MKLNKQTEKHSFCSGCYGYNSWQSQEEGIEANEEKKGENKCNDVVHWSVPNIWCPVCAQATRDLGLVAYSQAQHITEWVALVILLGLNMWVKKPLDRLKASISGSALRAVLPAAFPLPLTVMHWYTLLVSSSVPTQTSLLMRAMKSVRAPHVTSMSLNSFLETTLKGLQSSHDLASAMDT